MSRFWSRLPHDDALLSHREEAPLCAPPVQRQRALDPAKVAERVAKYRERIRRGSVLVLVEPDGGCKTRSTRDLVAEVVFAPAGSVIAARVDKITDEARASAARRGVELVEVGA